MNEAKPSRARLRRSDCAAEGIRRQRRGKGSSYVDPAGSRIEDEETVARIHELAIPPAWQDVWVCPDPLGHIQATGVDAAGRKQYLYHSRWQQRRAERKFGAARGSPVNCLACAVPSPATCGGGTAARARPGPRRAPARPRLVGGQAVIVGI